MDADFHYGGGFTQVLKLAVLCGMPHMKNHLNPL